MSLLASAQVRMKNKKVSSPTSTPNRSSPRSGGTNNSGGRSGGSSSGGGAFPFDVIPSGDNNNNNGANSNGVGRAPSDPPAMPNTHLPQKHQQQQQQQLQRVPQQPQKQQQTNNQQPQRYQAPAPSPQSYQTQQQKHRQKLQSLAQQSKQQQQQQRPQLSPSQSQRPPVAVSTDFVRDNSGRWHQNQQPQYQQQQQAPETFDDATRYQGSYTNYLSPRAPNRVPSRPRRRYDSFTPGPSDGGSFSPTGSGQDQEQAYDNFGFPVSTNIGDVHSAHRASPMFREAFPSGAGANGGASRDVGMQHGGRVNPQSQGGNVCDDAAQDSTVGAGFSEPGEKEEENHTRDVESVAGTDAAVATPVSLNNYDFEYHTEEDEGILAVEEPAPDDHRSPDHSPREVMEGANRTVRRSPGGDNQTVDSERALYGTPVKKKKHKQGSRKHKGGKTKIVIDNVDNVAGADDQDARSIKSRNSSDMGSNVSERANKSRSDPRYAIHHLGSSSMDEDSDDDGDNKVSRRDGAGLPPAMPSTKRRGQQWGDAHLGSNNRLIGVSKSWDSSHQDAFVKGSHGSSNNSSDDNAKQLYDANPSFGSFSRNLKWDRIDNGGDADEQQPQQPPQQQQPPLGNEHKLAIRASKSWGDENMYPAALEDSIATWGTWGDQTGTLFEQGKTSPAFKGSDDPFGSDKENLFGGGESEEDVNAKALAEWDRAEAEWRTKSMVEGDDGVNDQADRKNDGDEVLPDSFFGASDFANKEDEGHLMSTVKLAPKRPPPLLSPSKGASELSGGRHPWKQSNNDSQWVEDGTQQVVPSSDDDSIFEFEKKRSGGISRRSADNDDGFGAATAVGVGVAVAGVGMAAMATKKEQQAQDLPDEVQSSPSDIFSKINTSLEQAGKTKNRALGIESSDLGSERSEKSENENTDIEDDEDTSSKKKSVGFAIAAPQVHTYIAPDPAPTDDEEYTYDDEEDDSTLDPMESKSTSVSLNEMIGSESPQQQRQPDQKYQQNHSRIEKNFREMTQSPESLNDGSFGGGSDTDTYGDSTLGDSVTYGDGTTTRGGETTKGTNTKAEEGNPGDEWDVMDHVDNAVNMVAASLGGLLGVVSPKSSGGAASESAEKKDKASATASDVKEDRSVTTRSLVTETEDDEKSLGTDGDEYTYGESTMHSTAYTGDQTGYTENTESKTEASPDNNWLGMMKNMIFPPENKDRDHVGEESIISGTMDGDESTYYDDEDGYLLQQALLAARAIHHVQGVEFDETQELNVLTDVKFVVVTVSLPLGLLFQEHEIGVWVSRVVPTGNGAKKGVQHGDQLAAVNGESSIHTSIDEVADKISDTKGTMGVELTFLRYVGPLRPVPGSVIQEGFEVTDTSVSKKSLSKKQSKRGLFSRKSSKMLGGTPPSSPGTSMRLFADKSPKSPKRTRSSPRVPGPSPQESIPSSRASSRASSKSSRSITMPTLSPQKEQEQQQHSNAAPSTKKKKSVKKLLSFKNKKK